MVRRTLRDENRRRSAPTTLATKTNHDAVSTKHDGSRGQEQRRHPRRVLGHELRHERNEKHPGLRVEQVRQESLPESLTTGDGVAEQIKRLPLPTSRGRKPGLDPEKRQVRGTEKLHCAESECRGRKQSRDADRRDHGPNEHTERDPQGGSHTGPPSRQRRMPPGQNPGLEPSPRAERRRQTRGPGTRKSRLRP